MSFPRSKFKPVKLDKLKCDCEYIEACRGGCRYRAENFGDALGKDLYRCALYDIIKAKADVHEAGLSLRKGVSQ